MKLTNTIIPILTVSTAIFLSACSTLSNKPTAELVTVPATDDQLLPEIEVVIPDIVAIFEQGDTLWDFAERTTGSGYNWQQLKTLNKIENENKIDAGAKLLVPYELALESLKNQ